MSADKGGSAPFLRGHWITLEPVSNMHANEVADLDERRALMPEMGGSQALRSAMGRYGPPMLMRENRSGLAVGTLEAGEMVGYPGVAVLVIFADPERSRPGFAMEACGLYIPTLFERGVGILHFEVLSFNRVMNHLLQRQHGPPDVRLRRHAYVAGRFWDLLMYGFDRDEWEEWFGKFQRFLPGGSGRPSALGNSRVSG